MNARGGMLRIDCCYSQASQLPPLRLASRLQASFSAAVYSRFNSQAAASTAAAVAAMMPRFSLETSAVACSMLVAALVRR